MSSKKWIYKTGGIPDEMFIRDKVPMTKSEVRAVTLAKARLLDNHVVWDIGAGTGSISIEAALTCPDGAVYAIEKEEQAVELIRKNIVLFDAANITVCHGPAPAALNGLPAPDRVFVGGSGGNFREIMRHVYSKLPSGGRAVINAVVLETLTAAVEMMKELGFEGVDIAQVSIAKTAEVGSIHMFKSHNPVFVISGQKP